MKFKTYNCNSFRIHTIKTDKFKTCHLEIVFRKELRKEQLPAYFLLVDLLTESSKLYPTKKELSIRLEELYKVSFFAAAQKEGKMLLTNIMYSFISPKYINDKNYFEEVLSFPFETILNPNVENEEFLVSQVDLLKKRMSLDIRSIEESGIRISLYNAFKKMDKDSITSLRMCGTIEDLDLLTPSYLYQTYKDLLKNNICDIFLVGNIDMDKAVNVIKKAFNYHIINNQKIDLIVDNKVRKKPLVCHEKGPFLQANLVLLYNMIGLTKKEKDCVMQVFNYILDSGGLKSKLYEEIREKNSYCYSIESMTFKYDNILAIHVGLDNKNIKEAINKIKKVVNDMSKDLVTQEDLDYAKDNLASSLKLRDDNPFSLTNTMLFKLIDNSPDTEELKVLLKSINLDEVRNFAKKLKLNTVYVLEGKDNEED